MTGLMLNLSRRLRPRAAARNPVRPAATHMRAATGRLLLVPILFAAAAIGGCSSSASNLSMVSCDQHRCFDQSFQKAYTCITDNGDEDIVLVSDARPDAGDADGAGPLQPTHFCPRQVVHIRVFWAPIRGTRVDHPAATNASIKWYIFGDDPAQAQMVQYIGTGFVTIDPGSNGASIVAIRDATMSPAIQGDGMKDPLGPATLTGSIVATPDDGQISQILATVRPSAADQRQAAAN
jgi:hypothetical protein